MKIALAGAESNDAFRVFKQTRPPAVLLSNMYLQKKSKDKVEELLAGYKELGCWIIIDSGAFTFLSKYGIIRQDITMEEFRDNYNLHRTATEPWQLDKEESQRKFDKEFSEYFDKWLENLDLYYKYADMIAELDLDVLVGIDRMWELREKYEKYKDKICYTPHIGIEKEVGKQTPEERAYINRLLAYDISYMGIGNIPYKDIEQVFISFPEIKEHKIKIHGWAQTNWEAIQRLPYFSIDSTTWLSASKFGVTFEYKAGWTKMKSHDHTQKDIFRRVCQKECEENAIDFDSFMKDDAFSVLKWSALQWIRLARNSEEDLAKAYWLEKEEILGVIEEKREKSGVNNLVVRQAGKVSIIDDIRSEVGRMCNVCEISTQCPYFIANNTCAFATSGLGANLTSKQLMQSIIDIQLGRVSQAVLSERLKGGTVDSNVTKEMQVLARMVKDLDFMNTDGTGIHITAKGEKSVGVLEKLFGNKEPDEKSIINVEPIQDAEIVSE